jgi:hypothetical protein
LLPITLKNSSLANSYDCTQISTSRNPRDKSFPLPINYTEIANSSFLDFNSYRSTAAPLSGGTPATSFTFNVALFLDRANDPTPLLSADWGSRQQQLKTLEDNNALWSTYGADPATYNQVLSDLAAMGIRTVDEVQAANGYVSSVESRTIWVQVDHSNFTKLFGPSATLMIGTDESGNTLSYWNGNLSLPSGWTSTYGVRGVLFDSFRFGDAVLPNPGSGTAVQLAPGPQSPGNSSTDRALLFPESVAEAYNFPLTGDLWDPSSGLAVATGPVGLLEPEIGTAVPAGADFERLLNRYRREAGIDTPATVVTVAPGGQSWNGDDGLERSLDVGVVTGTNPQSTLVVYAGSGSAAHAASDTMTSYQAAFWDTVNSPEVVSSSWGSASNQPGPGSPFLWAAQQLFVDAALRNISVMSANGDGGSGNQLGTGVTNVPTSQTSSYILTVGGTSLSVRSAASTDPTLQPLLTRALAGDRATIWQLMAGGLSTLPSATAAGSWMIETVWNQYALNRDGTSFGPDFNFLVNSTVTGGVDPTQPVPSYQQAYGVTPTDPSGLTGRGNPDVSANAGGNLYYTVPSPSEEGIYYDYGTSAAAPLWAALVSQINAIFRDQGLRNLGYLNDLLYIAAVIAPASFNDTTIGNNTSSFVLGGPIDSGGTQVTPTGFGYVAGPGYDLTTGLGTPNGTILARTLTAIAHAQTTFAGLPDVLESDGLGGWTSGTTQSLLFQAMSDSAVDVTLSTGTSSTGYTSPAASAFAWTSQLAGQVLQADFDARLVTMFDGQAKGALFQQTVASGENVSIAIDSVAASTPQAGLSAPFGFVDFASNDSVVRVAQSVAVAETAGGQDDQNAVVRVRQNGRDTLGLEFYRVDDYAGTIAGFAPGSLGYDGAADSRAYALAGGGTILSGPGYGNYVQAELTDVDAGDLIAMRLINYSIGQDFWAFAPANEAGSGGPTPHLWNYGTNVWGWEDRPGGGDRDYDDLVVQLDFTSASGSGWLA